MEQSKKFIIIKLLFNSFILLSAVLTVLFGIFQVSLDLQEFENSELYSKTSYLRFFSGNSLINTVASIFFIQGVFVQFIFYNEFDHSLFYYISLILMTLSLLGSLFISAIGIGFTESEFEVEQYDDYEYFEIKSKILSGFYWGLLSIILIVFRQITTRIIENLIKKKENGPG